MILQNIPNIVFATTIIVVANTMFGQDLKPYFFSENRLCGYGSMVLRCYKIDVWTRSKTHLSEKPGIFFRELDTKSIVLIALINSTRSSTTSTSPTQGIVPERVEFIPYMFNAD